MATALAARRRRVDARSRALAKQIQEWTIRIARKAVAEEIKGIPKIKPIAKAKKTDKEVVELNSIIERFGVRIARDVVTEAVGGSEAQALFDVPEDEGAIETSAPILQTWAMRDYFAGKETRITGIAAQTEKLVRRSVQKIIQEARREIPTPSTGTIANRIRAAFVGEKPAFDAGFEPGPLAALKFSVSPERAILIARTEMVQAENSGIVAGYEATGVEEIEWFAYQDGRSGARRHDLMNGDKVKLGEKFTNRTTGKKLRFPGDPKAHISEAANCRCTVAAVRRPRKR